MHASILDTKWEKGQTLEMTYHTAFLDDAPEDSDVSNVIMMGHIPMLILSTHFAYQISADGTINFLGTAKEFLKGAKSEAVAGCCSIFRLFAWRSFKFGLSLHKGLHELKRCPEYRTSHFTAPPES